MVSCGLKILQRFPLGFFEREFHDAHSQVSEILTRGVFVSSFCVLVRPTLPFSSNLGERVANVLLLAFLYNYLLSCTGHSSWFSCVPSRIPLVSEIG
jgi:hypothetical protein